MAVYYKGAQFVTVDDLEFITADDDNFYVRYNDGYFEDTENKNENLNSIEFGEYTFGGRKVKSLKLHYESGLLTDQLAIDTMSAEIKSDTKPTITRYTPIIVKRDTRIMGVFFNGQIKEISENRYFINAESYISLLDYDYHFGGIYTAANLGTVVSEIMGSIPYTIHPDVAALKLYGYLPYSTKRENLQQILIATGAALERNSDGTINITVLTNTNKGTFTTERIFLDGSSTEDIQITAIQVTEHAYAPIDEEVTLFTESFTDIRTPVFDEPAHDLVCTNGTILESGANYAKIQGNGVVTLMGKKYRHTTKIVTKGTVLDTPDDKILSVTDATLITAINSSSVAERLYAYASCNKTTNQDVLINQERTGDLVQVMHPYSTEYLTSAIRSLDYSLSNTLRASCEFLVGYVPRGISEGYKNRVLLSESGTWTVPEDVTEIRVVLIGGGQGGAVGNDGKNGQDGGRITSVEQPIRANGGDGGKGGTGGTGGKVFDTTLTVTPTQIFSATIGIGGAGGIEGEGQLGTDTQFGDLSSSLGITGDYVDVMTADVYAALGSIGLNGGNGEKTNEWPMGWIAQNVTAPDGTVYQGGKSGNTVAEWIPEYSKSTEAYGGGGAGAAVGNNGSNGQDGQIVEDIHDNINAYGGNGGNGADATARESATIYGVGGPGGHGGGGAGGGGNAYHPNSSYAHGGIGGTGGKGGAGGNGAPGCVIIYY
ncbi:glycine-rich domain-containing protein [Anaerovorax sp. IOR16]|uniref:glycine-rich domain-containing protein n=1 Tax=Anaerovorax sp. IOR16 TaxID=2773458 RepID=UPI0024686FBD|nr:hypothetical protein [Anaerovorax sp. IOR16]